MRHSWSGIEPGDIGFDGGVGASGWIIRRTTGAYGHVWVYHELADVLDDGTEIWNTIEAGPKRGVQWCERRRSPVKVVRLWNNEEERFRILTASEGCLGAKYGWGEIARIALHLVGIKVDGWEDDPSRMICSNHAATAAAAVGRHVAMTMPYKPQHIWPQRFAEWCDWFRWTRDRNTGRS